MNKIHILSGVVTLVVGAGSFAAGYFLAKDRLGKAFDERLDRELEDAKRYYSVLHKKGEFDTPEKVAEKLLPPKEIEFVEVAVPEGPAKLLMKYGGHDLTRNLIVTEKIEHNVFIAAEQADRGETDEAWAIEEQRRTEEAPYILKLDEFMQNESDYTQVTLTYYSGDGVLTDDQDNPIEEIDEVVGDYNLLKFGKWSGDPRVVYVRNDIRELEAEITLNEGKYSQIVQGLV